MKQKAVQKIPYLLTTAKMQTRQILASALRKKIIVARLDDYKILITGDEIWLFIENSSKRVWVSRDEEPPTRVSTSIGAEKTFVTAFFSGSEMLHVSFLRRGSTMDAITFKMTVLKPLLKTLKERYTPLPPTIFLYYDNASAHTADLVKRYLEGTPFVIIESPAFSPDLAHSDFFLFGNLKRSLQGTTFETLSDLESAARMILYTLPSSMLRDTYEHWERRCAYVAKYGEYYRK
jgi:histone-lysine N-methyltransferase SETMAR